MAQTKSSDPAGMAIAGVFAKLGWALAVVGLLLALGSALVGTGTNGTTPSILARLSAAGPGLGVGLLGLFSVMVAAQTRAAILTADMTREMLVLARRGSVVPVPGPRAGPAPVTTSAMAGPALSAAQPKARTDPQVVLTRPKTEPRSNPIFSAKPPR